MFVRRKQGTVNEIVYLRHTDGVVPGAEGLLE
jgi:hypothetical protein